ncbi:MAG TPA: hypothetical protein VJT31_38375, partial [Rugosimonospora sp.]|nr:hypothetical protein [Rugosimonospora sp.]
MTERATAVPTADVPPRPREADEEAPAAAGPQSAQSEPARYTGIDSGVSFLLVLGLAWLATRLWSAYANIHDASDGLSRLIVAAYQLPDVIAASTMAGAAAGVAA